MSRKGVCGRASKPYLKRMRCLAMTLLMFAPWPASAHPHIFIDGGLEFIYDDEARLSQVRVTWEYDDFYSLLITEDYKLDGDFDGRLTPPEAQFLAGFDANWIEGYNGDLVIELDGKPLDLSGPLNPTAAMTGGRITTTHLRDVTGLPVSGAGRLTAKMFDPTHYTAYDVIHPVTVAGRQGCSVKKIQPNLDQELEKLQARLAALGPDEDPEDMGFPDVGDAFATEVVISCPGS